MMEGRPSRATSIPLSNPQPAPTPSPTATSPGVPTPAAAASPMAVEARAMMPPTDRSISPAITTKAIARATMDFSVKLKVASLRFQTSRK